MRKKSVLYSMSAFLFSVIAAAFFAGGIFKTYVDEYDPNKWICLIGFFPIAVLMITSLFSIDLIDSRRILMIIDASLCIVLLVDFFVGRTVCMPYVKTAFVYDMFPNIRTNYFTELSTEVTFMLLVFFIPLCKPIWTRAFCVIEIILYSVYILFYIFSNEYWFRSIVYFGMAYVMFYAGFLFVALMMKSYDEIEIKRKKSRKIDLSYLFNHNANVEIALSKGSSSWLDYASFYKYIRKKDFEAIRDKGYYGNAFARRMIIDLKDFFSDFDCENDKNLLFLKRKVNKLYLLINDNDNFVFEYFSFINLLSYGTQWDVENEVVLDVSSKSEFPINLLSNIAKNDFTFDDVVVSSMESFLQSLKFKNAKKQQKICSLKGEEAYKAGRFHDFWRISNCLYWKGKKINRYSKEYDELITKAYDAMAENNPNFVKILLSTEDKLLICSLSKKLKSTTVLTEKEFTQQQLTRLRYKYMY